VPKYSTSRAEAGEYFNPNLLEVAESPAASVDLSYFSQDGIPPGTYHLDVYINDKYVSSDSLTFQEISHDAGATASPCLSAEYLNSWLINTTAYPQLFEAGKPAPGCRRSPG
jgi:outer membrane usher protein